MNSEIPFSISMGENPPHFDSYLGGEQKLPSALNVEEFCKYRIEEILMLTESLKESPFRGQVFQRLPKHMRRRQMSHYIKRLPRRLRASSLLSKKNEVLPVSKCPSRKYRRRPKNLLLDYNRRQRKNIWLETHIWHAKRYHMTSKWGYRLPERPSNKSFRACYRAASQHCLLHDMSYYNCIQLKGAEATLLEGLQRCVSPACGLTFGAKLFKSGLREGSVVLYHSNAYPYKAIGRVSFLWKPVEECESERMIWIFCHPAVHNEIVLLFTELFGLTEVSSVVDGEVKVCDAVKESNVQKRKKRKNKNDEKLEVKNVPFQRVPKFTNEVKSISMCLLKDTLNRFRLTGPLSLAILSTAFDVALPLVGSHPPHQRKDNCGEATAKNRSASMKRTRSDSSDDEVSSSTKRIRIDERTASESVHGKTERLNFWWQTYYIGEMKRKCLESQQKFYERLRAVGSPSHVPPATVFSLVVKDPRLTIPSKRTKSTTENENFDMVNVESLDPDLCRSPIWDSDVRDEVSHVKMSTSDINKIRSRLIVPGSNISDVLDESEQARVPLLVIQRNDSSQTPLECATGFDIIVPAGWAMPVWLSLVYRGARTGGLRESQSLLLETNNISGLFQPDNVAGHAESTERWKKLRETYFKLPPSKRPNFNKNNVRNPFFFPWKALLKDWKRRCGASQNDENVQFFVLRDIQKLSILDNMVKALQNAVKRKKKIKFCHSFGETDLDCLVPVSIRSCNRGAPKEFAMLCVPTAEDRRNFSARKECPAELSGIDANEQIRKLARVEQTKLLKSLKRKRKKEKMKTMKSTEAKESKTLETEHIELSSEEAVTKYNRKMEGLWLSEPESVDSVIDSCSRTIMGYVVLGGFCYSKARGQGLGYVPLRALLFFLEGCYRENVCPNILFRNSISATYRFATLEVCSS